MTDRREPHLYNSGNKPAPTNPTSAPLPGAWPAEGETTATLYRFPSPHLLAMDISQSHLDLMSKNTVYSSSTYADIPEQASMTKLPPSVSALKASAAASHVDTSVATSHSIDRDPAASDTQRRPVSSQPHIAAQTSKLDLAFDKEMQNITNHLGNINIAASSNVHLGLDCTPTSRVASQPQLYNKGTLGGKLQVDSTSSQKSLPISDSMSNMDKQPPPRTHSLYSTLDPKDYPLKTYGPSPYKLMCGESNSEGPVNTSTGKYSQHALLRGICQQSSRESIKASYREKFRKSRMNNFDQINRKDVDTNTDYSMNICDGLAPRKKPPAAYKARKYPAPGSNTDDERSSDEERLSRARHLNGPPKKSPPRTISPFSMARSVSLATRAVGSGTERSIAATECTPTSRVRSKGRGDQHRENRSDSTTSVLNVENACNCTTMCSHVPKLVASNVDKAALKTPSASERIAAELTRSLQQNLLNEPIRKRWPNRKNAVEPDVGRHGRRSSPEGATSDDETEEESDDSAAKPPSVDPSRNNRSTGTQIPLIDVRVSPSEKGTAQKHRLVSPSLIDVPISPSRKPLQENFGEEFVEIEREEGWDIVDDEAKGEGWAEWLMRIKGGLL